MFHVLLDELDEKGEPMTGKSLCEMCIPARGFTGWGVSSTGWPVPDPLGREHPPEADVTFGATWRETGAALEGRLRRAA